MSSKPMTNYNERLDEILNAYVSPNLIGKRFKAAKESLVKEQKQAITSLIKELVAEAKPRKYQKEDFKGSEPDRRKKAFNRAIDQFEQNLLKALEEL